MSKRLLSALLCLSVLTIAEAAPVSQKKARQAAACFLHLDEGQLDEAFLPYSTMYLFDIAGGGFAIVAADDCIRPILAYSPTNGLHAKDMPSNLRWWLDGYDAQIRAAIVSGRMTRHPDWDILASGSIRSRIYESGVDALIETQWGQLEPYNRLSPTSNRQSTPAGCVAVAMGQLMRYWNWPEHGVGTHSYDHTTNQMLSADFENTTYDWENMPIRLSSSSSSAEIEAVTTLLYHCGVAVETMYTPQGSSAFSIVQSTDLNYPCAENALRNYFKYSPSMHSVTNNGDNGDTWTTLIKSEIDNHRPVLCGSDLTSEGHEYICDGYDTNGLFHFNWGWMGEGDGFYAFDNLTPLDIAGNVFTDVIVGIMPDNLWNSDVMCSVEAGASDGCGTVTGSGIYHYRDTVTLTAIPNDESIFHSWNNGVKLNPYSFLAHDVTLEAVFTSALIEDNDTLSYCGTEIYHTGDFHPSSESIIGIMLPSSALEGHDYLTAVDFYVSYGRYMLSIHRGGENAPGEVLLSQPFSVGTYGFSWKRITLEMPIAIDPDSNLWITIHTLSETIVRAKHEEGVTNSKWVSLDNGVTWGKIDEYPPFNRYYDSILVWYIRCITSAETAPDTAVSPTAYIDGKLYGNMGDTLVFHIVHSTISTFSITETDADYSAIAGDSIIMVWQTSGDHHISVTVSTAMGIITIDENVHIYDCSTPISSFPYVMPLDEGENFASNCWAFLSYGDDGSFYEIRSMLRVYASANTDDRLLSPKFIFNEDSTYWITFYYTFDEGISLSVEIKQADGSFNSIFHTSTSDDWVSTQNINLSEHYTGQPLQFALRIKNSNNVNILALKDLQVFATPNQNIDGIENIATGKNEKLTAWPNPASKTLKIRTAGSNGILRVYDATGRVLNEYRMPGCETSINVSTLPHGIYYLQHTSDSGSVMKRIAVK